MGEFESVKPYTQAELDQQAIWADEFAQWWEDEGQYHRAGGGQYERSFAWWAWLDREQSKQAIIDNLKAQLNNMEACYIEKKKEAEDRLNQTKDVCGRYDRLYEEYRLLELLVGNYRVLAQEVLPRCSRELLENIEGWEKALRGES